MLIGYARVSKADGSQSLDLQHDALASDGVDVANCYSDRASGKKDARPGLEACLKGVDSGRGQDRITSPIAGVAAANCYPLPPMR